MNEKQRDFSCQNGIKVIQSNKFIDSVKYSDDIKNGKLSIIRPLNLNTAKLVRIAISQCKIGDDSFFEYRIRLTELAKLLEVDNSNLYKAARELSQELQSIFIEENTNGFTKTVVFDTCKYDKVRCEFVICINPRLSSLFLNLKRDYTQYLITDILTMKCKYAIPLYELLRKEMKQGSDDAFIEKTFEIPISQIRISLGLTEKLLKTSHLIDRALAPSIKDISIALNWSIRYSVVRRGHEADKIKFIIINNN